MVEKMETLADFNKLMIKALDEKEHEELEAHNHWMENIDRRALQLVDLMLEKTKNEAMKKILPRTRGMTYMKLEGKIQQQQQEIRKAERGRERELLQFNYLKDSRNLINQEIVDVMTLVSGCLCKVDRSLH
jgi:hypothetical protein